MDELKFVDAVEGKHYKRLPSGILVVNHNKANPFKVDTKSDVPNLLAELDHTLDMKKKDYRDRLPASSLELRRMTFEHLVKSGYSVVVAFAGYDAAGKGGNIKKIAKALGGNTSELGFAAYKARNQVENSYPHWIRFFIHERFPKFGQFWMLDRFWYERMAVERVIGTDSEEALDRSFVESNMIESLITNNKVILIKFFMSITKEEQFKRLEARGKAATQEKLSHDDWEAHVLRKLYKQIFNEMIWRNDACEWNIVPAVDKRFSRVAVIERITEVIGHKLGVK
jgi:polyphosphate kinase 2 (PPK2 family)